MSALPAEKAKRGEDGEKLGNEFIHLSHCSDLYLSDLSLFPVPLS